jgi:RNA polymerase sigma-70 factor (ECF subfamily)
LVAASRRADKNAYAILVKRHYRYVYAACLGIVGGVQDAEDIAQEAMLKGYLKIRKLRTNERFDHWILKIARNLCLDFVRRKKHAKTYPVVWPARTNGQNNDEHHLLRAISDLPQVYRLPLVMFYFDNKSAKTIAQKLRISHSGAYQRIRAARERLHELLSERVNDEH